ncbi:nuclear transport factor 2 family protein [Pseudonocardiaceae bacterium YIM PH 21723]|nr:nuclear transport factor 2 family protein [Pseudonocardiaceae bacterium YIM PH 21723]
MEIQQLYARQVHLLDAGDAHGWAATFTPDGSFSSPTYGEPVSGPDGLAGIVRQYRENAGKVGEIWRHITSDLEVGVLDEHTVRVRAHQLIVASAVGEQSRISRVVALDDVVTLTEDGWRTRSKTITRDDLA